MHKTCLHIGLWACYVIFIEVSKEQRVRFCRLSSRDCQRETQRVRLAMTAWWRICPGCHRETHTLCPIAPVSRWQPAETYSVLFRYLNKIKYFASQKTNTRKTTCDMSSFIFLDRLYDKGRNRSEIMFVHELVQPAPSTAMYLSKFRCEVCHPWDI